jgi:hypothetical protein
MAEKNGESEALSPKEKDGCLYGCLLILGIVFLAVAVPLVWRLWQWGFHK